MSLMLSVPEAGVIVGGQAGLAHSKARCSGKEMPRM
jgi:hypothetical protein